MEYPFKDLLPLEEVLEREGYYKDWTHLDPKVFYSLTQISEYIKTKGFGVDVRLLIAQLAEHFGLKTTQVVNLANLLQRNFENLEGVTQSFTNNINSLVAQMEADKNAVIANVTVDSEVILARGGKATLGERLDETTEQLEDELGVDIRNFGVVGDGVVDDGPAIKSAHTWANANSKKLWYPPGEYYIRDAKEIVIEHDVDASQATIIVDTDIHTRSYLYIIRSKQPYSYDISPDILSQLEVNRGTTRIPELAGHGDAIIRLENENKKVYIRYGANKNQGVSQFDKFVIDDQGYLKNDVVWDFETITGGKVLPIDPKYINVVFGKWVYNNNLEDDISVQRNIHIRRSRVKLSVGEEITRPVAPLAHFEGLIATTLAYDVEIYDTTLEVKPARLNSAGVRTGTYGLQVADTISLTFRNVRSKAIPDTFDGWSIMGGNRLKDFRMIDCDMNNVDSHQGSHNISIKNSTIGSRGIHLTGTGRLHIEDVTIAGAQDVVSLRQDYGASWEGSIVIKNVTHKPKSGSLPHVVSGDPVHVSDFGYDCYFGTDITIDGYTVYDENITLPLRLIRIHDRPNAGKVNDYILPKTISVSNVRTHSGDKRLKLFEFANYGKFTAPYHGSYSKEAFASKIVTNVDVNVGDGDWDDTENALGLFDAPDIYGTGDGLLNSSFPYFNIVFTGVTNVYVRPVALPIVITLVDCTLRHLYIEDRVVFNMLGGVIDSRGDDYGVRPNGLNAMFNGVKILPPRKVDGSLITTPSAIGRAHDFLRWGGNGDRILMRSLNSGCTLSDDYPLSTVVSEPEAFGLEGRVIPNQRIIYRLYGPSSLRPTSITDAGYNSLPIGYRYFDTTLGKPIFYTGTGWRDSAGAGV